MKIIIPQVEYVFDCGESKCCSIILENQKHMYQTIEDVSMQIQGIEGISVLSENDKTISFAKYCEMISQFVPFDMNQRNLITKINSRMHQIAVASEYHMETNEFMASWEKYLMNLSMELAGNFEFTKITPDSLIKASGLRIDDSYENLGEQLLDYFELVQEYDARKLFILINLRSYMSDSDMEIFLENVLMREMQVLLIESSERALLKQEKRYIVDADLCVVC